VLSNELGKSIAQISFFEDFNITGLNYDGLQILLEFVFLTQNERKTYKINKLPVLMHTTTTNNNNNNINNNNNNNNQGVHPVMLTYISLLSFPSQHNYQNLIPFTVYNAFIDLPCH
jgi:hypothetical protein